MQLSSKRTTGYNMGLSIEKVLEGAVYYVPDHGQKKTQLED